jgi:hypothetical protein
VIIELQIGTTMNANGALPKINVAPSGECGAVIASLRHLAGGKGEGAGSLDGLTAQATTVTGLGGNRCPPGVSSWPPGAVLQRNVAFPRACGIVTCTNHSYYASCCV